MSTPQQGTVPAQEIGFPFGKNFTVNILSDNYPNDATLVLSEQEGSPVVRYRVGTKKDPILDQIMAVVPEAGDEVKFEFSLNPATPAQVAEGYITGLYTFQFVPPGTNATDFRGSVVDPRRRDEGDDDEWTAKGGGADDDES